MTEDDLLLTARHVVGLNLNEHVFAVAVRWEPRGAKLVLRYQVDDQAGEDEAELCDCAMTELLAAFPEATDCETQCSSADLDAGAVEGEYKVYSRPGP